MEHRELKLPLETKDIRSCLPHRHPFLLVDRVTSLTPCESIVACKNISVSDPVLQGHFPGDPVYPGVLIVESMAQAASILAHFSLEQMSQKVLLTEISGARFRRRVIPGDKLELSVSVEKVRAPFFWFDTKAFVDGELAARAKMSASVK